MATFEQVTTWPIDEQGVGRAEVPASWMQGRAAFGGLVATVAVRAARLEVPDLPVRSVITQFLAPVGPDALARSEAIVLKRGRTLTVVEARVSQGDRLCALVHVTFGADRSSGLTVPARVAPDGPPPGEGIPVPYMPGVSPAFLQHLDLRWTDGGLPFSGAAEALVGGWCRHQAPVTGLGAILGLLDAWPAPVLPMGTAPFPASSVHWTAYPLAEIGDGTDWLRFRATCRDAGAGTATMVSDLWDAQGRHVAWSEQLVAVFDA